MSSGSNDHAEAHAAPERRWQIIQTVIGMGILGIMGWFSAQFVDIRDGVIKLNAELPGHFASIEGRLQGLETRQFAVESAIEARNESAP